MSLKFAPLGWIYHDGWNYSDDFYNDETEEDAGNEDAGNEEEEEKEDKSTSSTTCYQRGHVHLFLPTMPFSKNGSSKAYSGKQTYTFEVEDEWGPNSSDPNQNQSVRLIGKPIWYVHVEEYWRRFYAQPWDVVDEDNKFPLNQTKEYKKRGLEEYLREYLSKYELQYDNYTVNPINSYMYSDGSVSICESLPDRILDGIGDNGKYVSDNYTVFIGLNDYITKMRRKKARSLYIMQESVRQSFCQYIASQYKDCLEIDSSGNLRVTDSSTLSSYHSYKKLLYITLDEKGITTISYDGITDSDIAEFIYHDTTVTDENDITVTVSLIEDFESFYSRNANIYDGYVSSLEATEAFMSEHDISMPSDCKISDDNTVLVPTGRTTGHSGIRYDASKPCHSLGPFREGGEFYFFNTVVNRTMPCEYWLDESKTERQYYIKQKQDGWETSGGQTWIFSGDSSHFPIVENTFEEAEHYVDGYNEDKSETSQYYTYTRRYPNLATEEYHYCRGMNAKRLKDDRSLDDTRSENSYVMQSTYAASAQVKNKKDTTAIEKIYEGLGVTMAQEEEEQNDIPDTSYAWECDGWTGWYGKGEICKCLADSRWYRRTWAPTGYSEESRFSGQQPYWSVQKRQNFPSPSPFLCDRPDGCKYTSSGSLPAITPPVPHWCNTPVYDTDEDNRVHLLHWQYALYFGLVRIYPKNQTTAPKRHFALYDSNGKNEFVEMQYDGKEYHVTADGPPRDESSYIDEMPADWETAVEEWLEDEEKRTPEGEKSLFSSWISQLAPYLSQYMDTEGYFDENDNEIPESSIHGSSYEHDDKTYPLPPRTLHVSYVYQRNDNSYGYQTYLTFSEFSSVWTMLTDDEVRSLKLDGDMPKRNAEPYKLPDTTKIYPDVAIAFRQIDPTITDIDINNYPDCDNKSKIDDVLNHDDTHPIDAINETISKEEVTVNESTFPKYYYTLGQAKFKFNQCLDIREKLLDGSSPSLLATEFFPVTDTVIRTENARRENKKTPEYPLYLLSPLDEYDASYDRYVPEEKYTMPDMLADVLADGTPIDPYRKGTVNPLVTWKQYFTHAEMFTIPDSTTVANPCGQGIHPRETSYSAEDGAKNMYPDDMYISPVIEYQKITYDGRLPGMEQDEQRLQANWKTDKQGNWGDGFSITVDIPWTIDDAVQSPFSADGAQTSPIGQYFHGRVPEENKFRYHAEFYDSLDQIRKYDFPNYISIIREFQKKHIPDDAMGLPENQRASKSYYREDFNDYSATRTYRETQPPPQNQDETQEQYIKRLKNLHLYGIPDGCACWQDALDKFWSDIDSERKYSGRPVARNTDCNGNQTTENAFMKLADGTDIWREQTTHLLPGIDKFSKIDGTDTYGFIDSGGNAVKAAKTATFSNPYITDGKWYEQCLGAKVTAYAVLILEDSLGYRWKQTVDATALQPDQPIRGSDYTE